MNNEKIQEQLYNYSPTGHCGVFMHEKVIKKLIKLTSSFEEEVRRVLLDNIDDLYLWENRLIYPDGKPTTIDFAYKNTVSIKNRISSFRVSLPNPYTEVYLGSAYTEEAEMLIANIESLRKVCDKCNK